MGDWSVQLPVSGTFCSNFLVPLEFFSELRQIEINYTCFVSEVTCSAKGIQARENEVVGLLLADNVEKNDISTFKGNVPVT